MYLVRLYYNKFRYILILHIYNSQPFNISSTFLASKFNERFWLQWLFYNFADK